MIDQKLNEIRRQLLDLTRNNRLLNHRAGGQRTLQIVDELPVEVFRILIDEEHAMQFLSREEAPAEIRDSLPKEASEASESLPPAPLTLAPVSADGKVADRHRDRNLQTFLSSQKLQTRLVHLSREANSALQEQGCNILYLTLGMIEWCDAEESSVINRAPLIFVPVELKRKNVNTRYSVNLFDDDIVANPSLIELCQRQFRITLPGFDAEKDDVGEYLAKVRQAVDGIKGWKFTDDIFLGLFSFSKLLMYRDLDPGNWPDGAKLTAHPLIQSLSGMPSVDPHDKDEIPNPLSLDQIVKPAECFQIVDADSSQQAAILAAKRGLSMVIDGPPGTGKSQTITNIIAECLAEGKTVLFVSEKAAALEVVKRRLEKRGMGDFVLELHSRQASKKTVLNEINRVLEKQAAARPVTPQTADELQRVRETLNNYHRDLHEPLGALHISPFAAMARAIGLASEPEAICDIPDVTAWTSPQLADASERLQTLDRRLGKVGDATTHPWRGVGLFSAGLKEKQRITQTLDSLKSAIDEFLEKAAQLASQIIQPAAANLKSFGEQMATAKFLLDAPAMLAPAAGDARWDSFRPELQTWLDQGSRRQTLKLAWQSTLKPNAEDQDWQPLLARRREQANSFLRFLNPGWYADGKQIKSFAIEGKLPPVGRQIDLLAAIVESRNLKIQIEQKAGEFSQQFNQAWQGVDGDWAALIGYAAKAMALRQLILTGRVDAQVAAKIIESTDRSAVATALSSAQGALDHFQKSKSDWLASIASDENQWLADWPSADLRAVGDRLADLRSKLELLDDWVDLRQSVRECSNSPLKSFVDFALGKKGDTARGRLARTFARHFHRLWVEESFARRITLRKFRGQDHDAVVSRFRELDEQWLDMTRHRLAERLAARRPEFNSAAHRQSKLGLLQGEVRKKTRHMPLRKLLKEVGEVVQAIKPCFMMSPLSIAQYLAPGGPEFDVVIFDEASQVEPADAYGAVARGRQLLLVGDEKQLPPTNFFDRLDPEETDDSDEAEVRAADLESILSLGIVRLRHRCGLRWHYRSRHSSLIEFSNEKFYDGQLRVFPSPHTDSSELGLAFHFVENAVYMRGAGRFNPVEAKTVAAAVIQHAIDKPNLSLGVGTLNQPQQRAIEDEIELLRRQNPDPRVEQFFADHAANNEPFFVKNLENIQGDERDAIFLSIGFGKDPNGRLHVSFGALNSEGGWRRLNVLITRARRRCIVFSSVRHDEIDLGATQARGVIALKEYLYAAETGRIKDMAAVGGDHDSEFEASVCNSLRNFGWEVHAQVGCAGFAIDLAIVDPRAPGRYLLGIECDGATYHSSPTARDRDRLRQEVLEDLGWTIHRIWSTDWFQRPAAELEKLAKRLDELKRQPPKENLPPPAPPPPESEPSAPAFVPPTHVAKNELPPGVVRYEHHRVPVRSSIALTDFPPAKLQELVHGLVAAEGPIHHDELARAIAEMFATKATARPREAIESAVDSAVQSGSVIKRDEFLWPAGDRPVQVRYRDEDCPVTTPELIPPEEFEAAIKLVVRQQFGLKFDAVIEAAIHVLGFARTGPKLKTALEQALVRLDQRGEIRQDNAGFVTIRQN